MSAIAAPTPQAAAAGRRCLFLLSGFARHSRTDHECDRGYSDKRSVSYFSDLHVTLPKI
jgi:hypothetical protein